MTERSREDTFAGQCKDALDQSLDQLDPVILERLRQNRHQAVHGREPSPRLSLWPFQQRYLAGASAAVVLVLGVSLWMTMRPPTADSVNDEIELAAQQGTLEMYRDLDFYQWLAQRHAVR